MKELTFEEFCAKPMELVMHISAEKEHYLHRANREVGVTKIVITKVGKYGGFGKSYTSYILKDDERVFTTADQVYLAYMEKVCGVNQ
jgi:acyl CoA:acetate/3-ketoacid CoA transferase alpha subunit